MPRPSDKPDKPKNMKATLKVFLKSVRHYRWWIIFSVMLTVASAILGLFVPKILGDMTTIAVNTYPNLDWDALRGKAFLAIGLFVASAILNYGQAFILAVVSAKYTKELREQILEKIFRMPIAYFDP